MVGSSTDHSSGASHSLGVVERNKMFRARREELLESARELCKKKVEAVLAEEFTKVNVYNEQLFQEILPGIRALDKKWSEELNAQKVMTVEEEDYEQAHHIHQACLWLKAAQETNPIPSMTELLRAHFSSDVPECAHCLKSRMLQNVPLESDPNHTTSAGNSYKVSGGIFGQPSSIVEESWMKYNDVDTAPSSNSSPELHTRASLSPPPCVPHSRSVEPRVSTTLRSTRSVPVATAAASSSSRPSQSTQAVAKTTIAFIMPGRGTSAMENFPSRDAAHVQRRDALARCVAATVLQKGADKVKCSLSIVFRDLDSFRLDSSLGEYITNPTETEIISLFRKIKGRERGSPLKKFDSPPPDHQNQPKSKDMEAIRDMEVLKARALFCDFLNDSITGDAPASQTAFVILHERHKMCPPFYDAELHAHLERKSSFKRLIFLCGGVDDWDECMVQGAKMAMKHFGVKALEVSLGIQPEFTSKIFHILMAHHRAGVLVPGLTALTQNPGKSCMLANQRRLPEAKMHFVLFVRVRSDQFSSEADFRPAVYGMCRILVYTLWKSHGLNKDSAATIVFKDRVTVTLDGARLYFNATETKAKKIGGSAPTEKNICQAIETFIWENKQRREITSAGMSYLEYSEDQREFFKSDWTKIAWKVPPRSAMACHIVNASSRTANVIRPYGSFTTRDKSPAGIIAILQLPDASTDPFVNQLKALEPLNICLPDEDLSAAGSVSAMSSHNQWGRLGPILQSLNRRR